MLPPLFVHLVFHPRAAEARKTAESLYLAWNADAALPGLRIPTVFVPEDGTELPPGSYELDESERAVVVVLVEDEMVADERSEEGRTTWSEFVVDLAEKCKAGTRRFIPVQFSPNGYPLDRRLENLNFSRAHLQTEEKKADWLTRVLTIELCRFLEGKAAGEQLPLQLFVSHAKADIKEEPKVFQAITAHLNATQPISSWVDSAHIFPGDSFPERITNGVKNSIVLALETKSYNTRTWCRREVLTAKSHQRPLVLVDALEGMDQRSFPYSGNTPRISWPSVKAHEAVRVAARPGATEDEVAAAKAAKGAAAAEAEEAASAAVNLLLKEALRHHHAELLLRARSRDGDIILPSAPELATIAHLPEGNTIFYPDPPLNDEEMDILRHLKRVVKTPLQRASEGCLLKGQRIILSISESDDTQAHGLIPAHLNSALDEVSRQLLVRGASLEYGGHLGAESYTFALFEMVRAYSQLSGLPEAERVINDVGWPLPHATLPADVRAKFTGVATLRRIDRPAGVEELDPLEFIKEPKFFPADSAKRRYAWARGMTAMREFQARESKAIARVAMGGKFGPKPKWYMGRIPGVVEEALLSLKNNQPLYLAGAFGGAAAMVIDLLEGVSRPEFTWKYQSEAPFAKEMKDLYDQTGIAWEDYDQMTEFFRVTGVKGLSAMNHLSEEQNRELFRCRDAGRITELILEGLSASMEVPAH
jgi:hypothetical protein